MVFLAAAAPSFAFQAQAGGHFTARKERRRRGGAYWIAYRHIAWQLVKKYIGPQAQVTTTRLEEIASELATSGKFTEGWTDFALKGGNRWYIIQQNRS
jgi:hypothetical protein